LVTKAKTLYSKAFLYTLKRFDSDPSQEPTSLAQIFALSEASLHNIGEDLNSNIASPISIALKPCARIPALLSPIIFAVEGTRS
jgi:hypothetical protein